jgi:(3,5-dihydroxyphenyl)acetyl-CoA 1,2-dioxygenase
MSTAPTAEQSARHAQLQDNIESIYDELTDGRRLSLRVSELAYAAADRFPGMVPTRAEIAAERLLLQKDKAGLEIEQGLFISSVLANTESGEHLIASMSHPKAESLLLAEEFDRVGSIDLGPVRVDRIDRVAHVTLQNNSCLNAEDDSFTSALEVAVDLVLMDDGVDVGVLRGGVATHPKYAPRRVFGSGINLTQLYEGKISLLEFMIERELGSINKMYRGNSVTEKPWIAAVDTFAIGGSCQWLLVMDRVIAETGATFVLPARKEGIIPGCANLRLPRFVGERLARQAIFFNKTFEVGTPEGRLLADDVVPTDDIDEAIAVAASELMSAGPTSLRANRRSLRESQEPLGVFRDYMSVYAHEQALCLYSQALIDNLERSWIRPVDGFGGTSRTYDVEPLVSRAPPTV